LIASLGFVESFVQNQTVFHFHSFAVMLDEDLEGVVAFLLQLIGVVEQYGYSIVVDLENVVKRFDVDRVNVLNFHILPELFQ
jgi:hypothetical protein